MERPLLQVVGLEKVYATGGAFSRRRVTALSGVDLVVGEGRTTALVGESGAGKSTLARCLARLERPTAGQVWFEGTDLVPLSERQLFPHRGRIQVVFQDPVSSLNPRLSALEAVMEPLVVRRWGTARQRLARAREGIERVGLPAAEAERRILEWSGGQRQRLALARALVLEPRLLVLDEALSALDPSVQAQVVNLLLAAQAAQGLACLLISHDLGLVAHLAHEVVVLHGGRLVESGETEEVLRRPRHDHTRALLAASAEAPRR
jgi:ABC-type glutathione transport system ATPase component